MVCDGEEALYMGWMERDKTSGCFEEDKSTRVSVDAFHRVSRD